mgnify:CR=1 FL=1
MASGEWFMYINRKGLTEDMGIKGTVKNIFFDVESMLIVMGKDTQSIAFDIWQDINDIKWDIFIYKMRSSGLLPQEEKPDKPSRFSSFASAFINSILIKYHV